MQGAIEQNAYLVFGEHNCIFAREARQTV